MVFGDANCANCFSLLKGLGMLPSFAKASQRIHQKKFNSGVRSSRWASIRFAPFAALASRQPSKSARRDSPKFLRRQLRELFLFVELPRNASTGTASPGDLAADLNPSTRAYPSAFLQSKCSRLGIVSRRSVRCPGAESAA